VTTAAELLEVARSAFAAAVAVETAAHDAPAEVTATPAVVLRPANPWLNPTRTVGGCVTATWTIQLIGSRYDLASSFAQLGAGYVAARRGLLDIGVGIIGPLGEVAPTEVASVPMLSATFPVTLPFDPGDP
jgi:hypothetical protein